MVGNRAESGSGLGRTAQTGTQDRETIAHRRGLVRFSERPRHPHAVFSLVNARLSLMFIFAFYRSPPPLNRNWIRTYSLFKSRFPAVNSLVNSQLPHISVPYR